MTDGSTGAASPVFDFTGEHAIVTGGSSGIGLATAKAFVRCGGSVTIVGRRESRLRSAVEAIGARATWIAADVTDEDDLVRAFGACDRADHLVTSAGPMPAPGDTRSFVVAEARGLFEGKFWGQLLTARQALPVLTESASITLFSGTAARKAAGGSPIFSAIDGAIESLARVMAIDLAPRRVNVIAPGIIDTPMLYGAGETVGAATVERYATHAAVGRAGKPEDVAKAVLLVMSNGFMTGAVVDVDGGKNAW